MDCSGGAQRALKNKFSITGFPTVVFCDSKGKKVDDLGRRDAGSVATQFASHAKKYTLKLPWGKSLAVAMEEGKKASKPVAVWVPDPKKKGTRALESMFFADEVMPLFKDFVLVKVPFARKHEDLQKIGITSGAVLVILDPAAEKPFKAVKRIRKAKTPKSLVKDLTKSLKSVKKAHKVSAKGS